jgi:hypothetical protein
MREEYDFTDTKPRAEIPALARLKAENYDKTRITINIDTDVLDAFRERAGGYARETIPADDQCGHSPTIEFSEFNTFKVCSIRYLMHLASLSGRRIDASVTNSTARRDTGLAKGDHPAGTSTRDNTKTYQAALSSVSRSAGSSSQSRERLTLATFPRYGYYPWNNLCAGQQLTRAPSRPDCIAWIAGQAATQNSMRGRQAVADDDVLARVVR